MVRVPGSLEDAGYHRESQEDKDVHGKKEHKTEEPLEDRSPVKDRRTDRTLGGARSTWSRLNLLKRNLNTLPMSS